MLGNIWLTLQVPQLDDGGGVHAGGGGPPHQPRHAVGRAAQPGVRTQDAGRGIELPTKFREIFIVS